MKYDYAAGVQAGDWLLELICEIQPERASECSRFLSADQLAPIFQELWRRSVYKRPIPVIEGLLSRTLKAKGLKGDLISLWGAEELFAMQGQVAPICEVPSEAGIIQLGSWTGESDGDGWCLDTGWSCVRCLSVGSGSKDIDAVRLSSYGIFSSLYQWVAYLRCDAWERGWASPPGAFTNKRPPT